MEKKLVKCVYAGFMSELVDGRKYFVIEEIKIGRQLHYAVEDCVTGQRVGFDGVYYDARKFV